MSGILRHKACFAISLLILSTLVLSITISAVITNAEENKESLTDNLKKKPLCDLKVKKLGGKWTDGPINVKVGNRLMFMCSIKANNSYVDGAYANISLIPTIKVVYHSISPRSSLASFNDLYIVWHWFFVPKTSRRILTFRCSVIEKGSYNVTISFTGWRESGVDSCLDTVEVISTD